MAKINQNNADNRSLVPKERRRRIAELIRGTGSVTVAELEERFGISPMTARRDLTHLEKDGELRRTHGGAMVPGFAGHEDSFQQRAREAVPQKEQLARAAVSLLSPGESVFVDSSTTSYYAVRRMLEEHLDVTVLTNLIPTMELFSTRDAPNVKLIGFGGYLRQLTLSFVGPQTIRATKSHFADKALISVKGVTPGGYLTDPDPLEAEVKQAMVKRSQEPILLVDGNKFERRGLHVIGHISEFEHVLVADVPSQHLEGLVERGVEVTRV